MLLYILDLQEKTRKLTAQFTIFIENINDGICAEALKAAHRKVYVLLSLCFSLCMSHGYIPIVPIIKKQSC